MNVVLLQPPKTTRGADGFDRRAFTVADIVRMQEAGILDEDESFELIDGEIVCMQAKNYAHERIKLELIRRLARAMPDHLCLGVETTLYLSETTALEPDLSIIPRMNTEDIRGPDVLLAIKIANTTLVKDLTLKAPRFAKYGVPELWVIDATRLETHVHSDPMGGTWSSIETKGPDEILMHPSVPGFTVTLAEI